MEKKSGRPIVPGEQVIIVVGAAEAVNPLNHIRSDSAQSSVQVLLVFCLLILSVNLVEGGSVDGESDGQKVFVLGVPSQ